MTSTARPNACHRVHIGLRPPIWHPTERKVTCCSELSSSWASRFYRNRFARVAPVYWVVNIIALPLAWTGYGWVSADPVQLTGCIITTMLGVQTWLGGMSIFGALAGPGWTVSTLAFFWCCFPLMLTKMLQGSDEDVPKWRVNRYFWLNIVLAIICYAAMDTFGMVSGAAFWFATGWPPSRLPVFMMGALAGIQCVRSPATVRPFKSLFICCSQASWACIVDRSCLIHVVIMTILIVLENALGVESGCGLCKWRLTRLPA